MDKHFSPCLFFALILIGCSTQALCNQYDKVFFKFCRMMAACCFADDRSVASKDAIAVEAGYKIKIPAVDCGDSNESKVFL